VLSPGTETLDDFVSYDVVKLEWKALVTTGSAPGTRTEMGMVAAADRVFVFGGSAGSGPSGERKETHLRVKYQETG
jgi:hypothetical protein